MRRLILMKDLKYEFEGAHCSAGLLNVTGPLLDTFISYFISWLSVLFSLVSRTGQ